MYKIFLFLLVMSTGKVVSAGDSTGHDTNKKLLLLKQHVLRDILNADVKKETVLGLASRMKADGSWADIDYTDKTRGGWPVNRHLEHLEDMAVLYKRSGSGLTGNKELERKILLGLNFWLKNDFICPNWWYPEIGVPKVLGPAMLLMEDRLTRDQLNSGIKILSRAKIRMTGQNKVWLSGNVIYRSLLTGDAAMIDSAVKAIQEEVVVSEAEGIQPDYSFHQHGTQQQFGNYGASFAEDMLKWALIFKDTPFQFDDQKTAILRNYLLNGMRWVIWHNQMDISACGRQLFPDAPVTKAAAMKTVLEKMPVVDPAYSAQYKKAMQDFTGDHHFWKSDMTVHRSGSFYASVKMSSNRVGGSESCNSENVLGYHLGDGATYFYRSGAEYTNVFPFWDWKLVPGTTTYHDAAPLPVLPCSGYNIKTDFAGGVSNGSNGIATLAYHRDGLDAQKSWFFFGDAIVCLGAGIRSAEDKEVTTSVNQSLLHGDVIIKKDAGPQVVQTGEHTIAGVAWVLHDGWGYYFPGKAGIELTNGSKTGDWNRVMKSMPSSELKADLFTLWFNHHNRPEGAKYAYYVFPSASASGIDTRAASIRLIQNTEQLQVVENTTAGMSGFVFVQAGEAFTKTSGKITVDKPCLVLTARNKEKLDLSVSDPTHLLTQLTIGLPGKRKSQTLSGKYDPAGNTTSFTIELPQGGEAGKTFRLTVAP